MVHISLHVGRPSYSIVLSHKDTFPFHGKQAYVTLIYKKDDKFLPGNYRPISLLGKAMECKHKCLYDYITVNDILRPLQSGFRHGDSTTSQLLHTYHTICEAVNKSKDVRTVFFDISKDFSMPQVSTF